MSESSIQEQAKARARYVANTMVSSSIGSATATQCNLICYPSQAAATPKAPRGYNPSQIKKAYNIPTTPVSPRGNAKQVSVAIIIAYHYPKLQPDFDIFCNQYGLPKKTLDIVNLGSPTNISSGWQLEECLDIQWSYAMNPSAKFTVVEAKSNLITDLCVAIQRANDLGADIVSMSWGCTEAAFNYNYNTQTYFDNLYLSNPSVCYVAATGDTTATPCWPALCPNVIACGGTSLTNVSPLTESTWVSAGCGASAIYKMPSYQSAPCSTSVTMQKYKNRCVPDVSCVANPGTGVSVFYGGYWWIVGGTSVSTPITAGALSNAIQTRLNSQKPAITSAYTKTQTRLLQNLLYLTIYGNSYANINNKILPPTPAYTANFFDIIKGSDGIFTTASGMDMPTGVGSINWTAMIQSIANM